MNILLAAFAVLSFFSPLVCADFSLSDEIYELCLSNDEKSWENFINERKEFVTSEIVNERDNKGLTLLHVAILNKKLNIALFLIERGADVNAASGNDGNTPLHLIIDHIPFENLKQFLLSFCHACGKNLNLSRKNNNNCTPLYYYLYRSIQFSNEIIERLILSTADINEKNSDMEETALHLICRRKSKLISFLIEKGAEVNERNNEGSTPLHQAILSGYKENVEALLESKKISDINDQDNNGYSALHTAAENGRLAITKYLLEMKDIDINKKNNLGNTALHIAVKNNHAVIVESLLQCPTIKTDIENKERKTALALTNNPKIIELFSIYSKKSKDPLASNPPVPTNPEPAKTPFQAPQKISETTGEGFFEAIENGELSKVEKFLKDQPNLIQKKDKYSNTPLHLAVMCGRVDIAKKLLKLGPQLIKEKNRWERTPLQIATMNGIVDIVEEFLKDQPDLIQEKDTFGDTPLHRAAEYGRVDIVKLLVSNKKIDINAKNNFNETALHKAVCCCSNDSKNETLPALLNVQGIDVNIKNNSGATPLHGAASDGSAEDVELLIKNGAKVNEKNNEDETPLFQAIFSENRPVIAVLIQNGADVNEITTYLDTPLHIACINGFREIVELLVQSGANIYAKDGQDKTPFEESTDYTVKEYLSKVMRNRTISSGMQITSLCLAAGAAVCAWYESKTTPPSKEEKKNNFKKILSRKKKTIFLGLASLALFGGSFCIKKA